MSYIEPRTALAIIICIAIAGMLFSGYLSYKELSTKSCPLGCSLVGKVPACVYGLIMYTIVFIIALLGLIGNK